MGRQTPNPLDRLRVKCVCQDESFDAGNKVSTKDLCNVLAFVHRRYGTYDVIATWNDRNSSTLDLKYGNRTLRFRDIELYRNTTVGFTLADVETL
jgi:hypothetical protein